MTEKEGARFNVLFKEVKEDEMRTEMEKQKF